MKSGKLLIILGAAAAMMLLTLATGCSGNGKTDNQSYEFEVSIASAVSGVPVPVTVKVPENLETVNQSWEVAEKGGQEQEALPAQICGDKTMVFLWDAKGKPGVRQFIMRPVESTNSPFVIADSTTEQLVVSENGRPAIGYVFGMHLADGVPEDRRRSSYFHPVWGVNGRILSDDFPVDHYHHRGFFWTWPQVFYGGDTLSLWDIQGVYQKHESWTVRETGPVFARLGVQNGWYLDDGSRIADERVTATIYRSTEEGRIIDFDLRWEATGDRVGIQGSADIKGYGGFSLRFAPFEDPVITTVAGVQDEDSNRIPTPWADLSARFGGSGSYEGVAIFDHKDNLSFPNGWCLRHYGFEGIAWPGIEPYWLEPGKPLVGRYRVWIHDGDAVAGKVSDVYNSWAEPVSARAAE